MKKNLILLTGIVFILSILLAGGCNRDPKPKEKEEAGNGTQVSTTVPEGIDIFLRAVLIDGVRHLEMFDSKKDKCPAIDGLITEVNSFDTVYWKKATASKINEVTLIRLMTDDYTLYGNIVEKIKDEEGNELWKFIVPGFEEPDTIKYEIHFTVVGNDEDTTIIDPYLKLPRQQ